MIRKSEQFRELRLLPRQGKHDRMREIPRRKGPFDWLTGKSLRNSEPEPQHRFSSFVNDIGINSAIANLIPQLNFCYLLQWSSQVFVPPTNKIQE